MDTKLKSGKFLTFAVATETYGIPTSEIREINQLTHITAVPQTPDYIEGVMNLRGKVIPVINLGIKLGLPRAPYTKTTCVIIIQHQVQSQDVLVGMIVDAVNEVIELTSQQIDPVPLLGDDKTKYILGMGRFEDKVLILLDVEQTLGNQSIYTQVASSDQVE